MRNLLLLAIAILGMSTAQANENNETETINDILCVENNGYSRASFILYFKGEAVSKITVGGGQDFCFEIGTYESSYQWKAAKIRNGSVGSKKGFYSNTATFY